MIPTRLFIDFDETLFHHYRYLSWLDDFLQKYGVAAGSYRQQIDAFHQPTGENMRLYDHDGHIQAVSGRNWAFISGEVERQLTIESNDFCYPEAHEFLQTVYDNPDYDVRLLTYGNGEYQRYKIHTCRLLSKLRLPTHIVNQPKRIFLEENYNDEHGGILIDDKHPLKLPGNWHHVWIDRSVKIQQPEFKPDQRVIKISSLLQFSGIARRLQKYAAT